MARTKREIRKTKMGKQTVLTRSRRVKASLEQSNSKQQTQLVNKMNKVDDSPKVDQLPMETEINFDFGIEKLDLNETTIKRNYLPK
jgi:transcription initiation factor IIF auxiliary subunit